VPGSGRPVVLDAYDPEWPHTFAGLRDEIAGACGDLIAVVEHVGSTAVPGLGAKPIIDVMPGLHHFEDGQRAAELLAPFGYEYRGEFGIPGRHYFVKDDRATGERIANVHMYAVGHDEWVAHLAFRDYLRRHDRWRDRYFALKQALAARYPNDVEAYAEAKTAFVKDAVVLSLAESGSSHVYQRVR
jgi:GrpB-like predicted nucleotidyltransferase (UPF0157 family)